MMQTLALGHLKTLAIFPFSSAKLIKISFQSVLAMYRICPNDGLLHLDETYRIFHVFFGRVILQAINEILP